MGRSGGRARRVTPPIIMPESACVSSAVAKDTRETSMRRRTAWFTSRRVVASTRQAQNFFGSFLEATMMVLPEWSRATPYCSQKAAVSAKSGSMRMSSHFAPRLSRAWATLASMAASSLMRTFVLDDRSGGGDLDEAGVVGRGARGGGAVLREHVGAASRVVSRGVGREPGAFLDRDHPPGDAVRHVRGEDSDAALIEHAHGLAVHDAAGARVVGMNPHVLLVRPRQDLLVVVGRVGAGARLGGDELEGMARVARMGRNPRGNGRDTAEPVRIRIGGDGGRVDLDLPRRRREGMPRGIAHFPREGHRILGGGEARETLRAEGIEVVDVGALAHLAQPVEIGRPLVALEPVAL